MEPNDTSPQAWLQSEFCSRRKKNPGYSLRRMAQQLDMSSGRLSELINGRRRITLSMAIKIAEKLAYSPEKRQRFLQTLAGRGRASQGALEAPLDDNYLQLSADAFHILADWYHFAILSLIEVDDFDPAPSAISARLGITVIEARASLDRLKRAQLIREVNGKIEKTAKNITTTHDIESSALKVSHQQNLSLAAAAIDEVGLESRDFTSMTMAIDAARLPIAKEMIRKFRRQLCLFLESGKKNDVYNLNVQLFPLTKKRGKK